MSEQKPLCPDCGREMIVPVYRDYMDQAWIACCRCNECDAKWKTGNFKGKTKEEAAEKARAAALRRPFQKPLTLEELNECDIFYIEFRDINEGNFIPVQFSPETHFKGMLTYHRPGWATHFSIEMFGCGRYWRCWRTRPTIEERAAAPWED